MNQNQENALRLICTVVGTVTPILTLGYSILKDSLSWVLFAIVSCVSILITIIQFLFYNKRIKKLHVYDELLNTEYPLYGVLNYLSRKDKINLENKINGTYQLDTLSLFVKLVDVEINKHNDLLVLWSFNGNNIGKKDISEIYLRIGGDSSTDFDKLNVFASQCNYDNDSICDKQNKPFLCPSINKNYTCNEHRRLMCTSVKELSSATFNLLKFSLAKPIQPSHMLKMKVSYVWPQCFNPNYDYLLIDPKNFGVGIKCLNITIICDDVIIKRNSQICLTEINYSVYEKNGKGSFEFDEKNNSFCFQLDRIDPNCIYYAEIMCN